MVRPILLLAILLSLSQVRAQSPAPAESVTPAASDSSAAAVTATPQPPTVSGGAASTTAAPVSVPRVTYSHVNVDGPYIAMTFDDGPSAANTAKLLDLAAKDHIKLTFFLIGENVVPNPKLVQRELAEGHEIGNHSYTHPDLAKMSDDAVRSQIQKTQDAIISASGYRPTLFRPPYGAFSAKQRLEFSKEFGVKIILWEVDPLDWKNPGPEVVAQRILSTIKPGDIVLSHDIHSGTVAAMPEVFSTLLARGYKFVTVSELIAMDKGPAPTPAKKPKATSKSSASSKASSKASTASTSNPASTQ